MEFIVLFLLLISFLNVLYNMSGFALGQTYNYQTRKKTYHGTKLIVWSIIVYVIWNFVLPLVF